MNELKLPELGENIEVADISAVLVSAGDWVRLDQPVIEVETEKASLEVPATVAGRVQEIRVKTGEKIRVGEVILVIDSSAEERPETEPAPAERQASETEDTEAPQPRDDPAPAPAPTVGREERPPARAASAEAAVVEFPRRSRYRPPAIGETVPAAPSVRALARELGVDVREVAGSGPGGRISRDDVKAHVKRLVRGLAAGDAAAAPAGHAPELPDFGEWGPVEREPLGSVRLATARAMARAWTTVPHVTQFDHSDITQLEKMRRKFNQRAEADGRKLTLTAIVVKMAAAALRQFPRFNASVDLARQEVVRKGYVHVGVAVDTERGLLVPVIRDVDRAGLLQIAERLNDLAERARSKKLKPDEMRGASFTVSNLGGLGTTYFSPIVNWPEVSILGVGRAQTQAVWEEGQFKPRLILPLAISYDHRLIDGADAARFLRWIAEALEQPLLLLLEDGERP